MEIPYREGIDYFVYFARFPSRIGAAIVPNYDGTYTVYLNLCRPAGTWEADIYHEFAHIYLGHLCDESKTLAQKEAEADALAAEWLAVKTKK